MTLFNRTSLSNIKIFFFEIRSWVSFFTLFGTIFVLCITITNFLSIHYDIKLLPIFKQSLESFRIFTHITLGYFIYKPLIYVLCNFFYAATLVLSRIISITPFLPSISPPSWLRDFGIVSLILLRSQRRAMKQAAPVSLYAMNKIDKIEWKETIKKSPASLNISIFLSWKFVMLIYLLTRFITYPIKFFGIDLIRNFANFLIGGSLMLGIAYFVHDVFVTVATRRLSSSVAVAHRRFMLWMTSCLVAATFASLFFLAVNGYLIQS